MSVWKLTFFKISSFVFSKLSYKYNTNHTCDKEKDTLITFFIACMLCIVYVKYFYKLSLTLSHAPMLNFKGTICTWKDNIHLNNTLQLDNAANHFLLCKPIFHWLALTIKWVMLTCLGVLESIGNLTNTKKSVSKLIKKDLNWGAESYLRYNYWDFIAYNGK